MRRGKLSRGFLLCVALTIVVVAQVKIGRGNELSELENQLNSIAHRDWADKRTSAIVSLVHDSISDLVNSAPQDRRTALRDAIGLNLATIVQDSSAFRVRSFAKAQTEASLLLFAEQIVVRRGREWPSTSELSDVKKQIDELLSAVLRTAQVKDENGGSASIFVASIKKWLERRITDPFVVNYGQLLSDDQLSLLTSNLVENLRKLSNLDSPTDRSIHSITSQQRAQLQSRRLARSTIREFESSNRRHSSEHQLPIAEFAREEDRLRAMPPALQEWHKTHGAMLKQVSDEAFEFNRLEVAELRRADEQRAETQMQKGRPDSPEIAKYREQENASRLLANGPNPRLVEQMPVQIANVTMKQGSQKGLDGDSQISGMTLFRASLLLFTCVVFAILIYYRFRRNGNVGHV